MGKIKIRDDFKLIIYKENKEFTILKAQEAIKELKYRCIDISIYNRFLDFSTVETVRFRPMEMDQFSKMVKKIRPANAETKICFLCKDLGVIKLVEIFTDYMKPDYKKILISQRIDDCTDFLDVDESILLGA